MKNIFLENEISFYLKDDDFKEYRERLTDLGFEMQKDKVYQRTYNYTNKNSVMKVRYNDNKDYYMTIKGKIAIKNKYMKSRYKVNLDIEDIEKAMVFASMCDFNYYYSSERMTSKFVKDDMKVVLNYNPFGRVVDVEGYDFDAMMSLASDIGLTEKNIRMNSGHADWEKYCKENKIEDNNDILFVKTDHIPKKIEDMVAKTKQDIIPLSIDDIL